MFSAILANTLIQPEHNHYRHLKTDSSPPRALTSSCTDETNARLPGAANEAKAYGSLRTDEEEEEELEEEAVDEAIEETVEDIVEEAVEEAVEEEVEAPAAEEPKEDESEA